MSEGPGSVDAVRPRRLRLDALLCERGLFPTRSRAAAAVLAGEVEVQGMRRTALKPGHTVPGDAVVSVSAAPAYVSRGGTKLANALDGFGLDVSGARALDVGASTGGFTDCLLQRGAAHVVALDVAYGELHWSLRTDPRVTVIERANARRLRVGELPWPATLVVMDLSFISLVKVLPAVLGCADPAGFDCLAMIKPQFEVGRERVGRGGVVREPALRREALVTVGAAALALGAGVRGYASSGLPGPKGNRESFAWLCEPARGRIDGGAALAAAAAEVEPQ